MSQANSRRLRLIDFINVAIIQLLFIGNGACLDIQHWGKLFSDKPLLRFVTFLGDGLGAEIDELSYYQSDTESSLHVWWLSSRLDDNAWVGGTMWSGIKVYQFSQKTRDERYNHIVEVRGGKENLLWKGDLLIPITAGEGRTIEVFHAFDEKAGPISSSVILRAVGGTYRADIRRSTDYIQHHGFLLGLPELLYSCIKLCFNRPLVALSYYFPLTIHRVASLIAYLPGLTLILVSMKTRTRDKQ